ncbi:MAG: hypothetical protein ACOY94_27215 [Bacillota bacterium]
MLKPEVGHSYRLVRDLEVRDEHTGTLKHLIRKGDVVKVKKIEEEMDRIYLEGVPLPAALRAFGMHIQAAGE